jgi:hypothetical protein
MYPSGAMMLRVYCCEPKTFLKNKVYSLKINGCAFLKKTNIKPH